ncbi:hypothetical protein DCS_06390 [Drechmeria coniospora]|uniref:Mpv17/PMP22 family protein n=1 Tax=Drechmeria coniospora TaxID=98403 RepID=A0A151GBE8_DRECN|nr:hypothetical protein DCS_06390 [Drechmeria coniospora]KYK54432.1 hypothetical protein DCS_06390 [Drechmeria coniospora]
MSLEQTAQRIGRAANSRYLFGRIVGPPTSGSPAAAVGRSLERGERDYYEERPLMTMMVTNAVLGGIADTVAQIITAIRHRATKKLADTDRHDNFVMEINELGRKNSLYERDSTSDAQSLAPPLDFERLIRFMTYGFCIAPLQFKWFRFLEHTFPMTKASASGPAMKRVALDQFIYAPFGVALFFIAMTIAEGGGRRAVHSKLREMYVPTLKANYVVWPAVQVVNFRLMPVMFQLPFVSTVGIAWTAYLSLTNASD